MSFLEDRKQAALVAERARELLFLESEPISLSDFCDAVEMIGGRCTSVEKLERGEARIVPVESEDVFFELQYLAELREPDALFALVREFGHFLLHKIELGEERLSIAQISQSACSPAHERQASEFAAAFLMPEQLFEEMAREIQITDVMQMKEMATIADYFHVSVQASMMRGIALIIW